MWEAPSWIGSAITSKVNERVAGENRQFTGEQNDLDRANNLLIARERNDTTRYQVDVAADTARAQRELEAELQANKLANEVLIAQMKIDADTAITQMNIDSRELIDALGREMTVSENEKNRQLTRSEGALNRSNAIEVANITAAAKVASEGVRLTPFFVGKFEPDKGDNNKDTTGKSKPATSGEATVKESLNAKQRADALFPNVEPTFNISPREAMKTVLPMAAGAALISGLMQVVPFI